MNAIPDCESGMSVNYSPSTAIKPLHLIQNVLHLKIYLHLEIFERQRVPNLANRVAVTTIRTSNLLIFSIV